MDCLLRVMKGPDAGQEQKLSVGANIVGRADHATVRLTAADVSWEHAVVTRNGEDYVLTNLSAHGTVMEGQKVAAPVRLRPRDQFQLGEETVVRLEAVGGGRGEKTMLLWLALFAMVGLGAVLVYLTGGGEPAMDDWEVAYRAVEPYFLEQVKEGDLPPQALAMLKDAWRLEKVGDFKGSHPLWTRLQMMLHDSNDREELAEMSGRHPTALEQILQQTPAGRSPSWEMQVAAAVQFVNRRAVFAAQKAYPPKKKAL